MMSERSWSASQNLSGQSVLLTGVTGYVGQIVLHKLVCVAPHIKHIFLLIRPNRTQTAQQRFDQLLNDSLLFIGTLAQTTREKCTVLSGDVSLPLLGISAKDHQLLSKHLTLVIHSAANVSFTAPFADSVSANLVGTKHVLDLIHTFPIDNTPRLCYVSTAYVSANLRKHTAHHNAPKSEPPADVDSTQLCSLEPSYLEHCHARMTAEGWPNAYTMSKALAEDYLQTNIREGQHVIAVRPSMVVHVARDLVAVPGFNLGVTAGPSVCTYAIGTGALTVVPAGVNGNTLDIVPADYVANVIVCAAASMVGSGAVAESAGARGQSQSGQKVDMEVIYAVMGEHRVDIHRFMNAAVKYFKSHPIDGRLRRPRVYICHGPNEFQKQLDWRYRAPLKVLKALKEKAPSSLVPQQSIGQLIDVLEKVLFLASLVEWVVAGEFVFDDGGKCDALFQGLEPSERRILWNDLESFDHDEYVMDFCEGVDRMMRERPRPSKL